MDLVAFMFVYNNMPSWYNIISDYLSKPTVISVRVPSIKIPVSLPSIGQREIGTTCR